MTAKLRHLHFQTASELGSTTGGLQEPQPQGELLGWASREAIWGDKKGHYVASNRPSHLTFPAGQQLVRTPSRSASHQHSQHHLAEPRTCALSLVTHTDLPAWGLVGLCDVSKTKTALQEPSSPPVPGLAGDSISAGEGGRKSPLEALVQPVAVKPSQTARGHSSVPPSGEAQVTPRYLGTRQAVCSGVGVSNPV